MYNLIMTSSPGYWQQSPQTFMASRIFEYTKDSLIERFKSLEGSELRELISLPTLFAYENANGEEARVGRITEFRKRGDTVRIAFELDDAIPAISSFDFKKLEWELDVGEYEFNRTHWAVKDIDLLYELHKGGKITEAQQARTRGSNQARA